LQNFGIIIDKKQKKYSTMRRAFFLISILFLQINFLFSQNNVIGVLVDSLNNERMPFVNVGLMRAADSVFVAGTSSNDEGHFKLEHIPNGKYVFFVSSIGYESIKRTLDIASDLDLGVIKMKSGSTRLDEVVIVEKRPLFSNEGEKTLYNVSEDPSVQTGTVSDALQNAPGVEVDVEGNVCVGDDNVFFTCFHHKSTDGVKCFHFSIIDVTCCVENVRGIH
jgi:hypothetical protein